jgi:type IV secretory pathway TrbL component
VPKGNFCGFLFFFSLSPIIALLKKCYRSYVLIIALALKVLLKAFEIRFLLFIIALLIVKRYYKYLVRIFNSTSVKVLLN